MIHEDSGSAVRTFNLAANAFHLAATYKTLPEHTRPSRTAGSAEYTHGVTLGSWPAGDAEHASAVWRI